MNTDVLGLAQFFSKYWHTKIGLLVSCIASLGCASVVFSYAPLPVAVYFFLIVASPGLVLFSWVWSRRIPKTPKKKVGLVVCIFCDDDEESRKVQQDFVVPLRSFLKDDRSGTRFHFIEVPQYIACRVLDREDAERLRIETRAHFLIYGRVRVRILDGRELHVIDLHGLVRHRVVAEERREEFAKEFSELFPKKVNIYKDNDFIGFGFTSEWAGIVAQYIIGIAASFSGDLDYAEALFSGALAKLKSRDQKFPVFSLLMQRIPARISELYEVRAIVAARRWHLSHDSELIDELGSFLEKVLPDKQKSAAPFLRALHAFLAERNTAKARQFLKKVRGAANGSADPRVVGTWNCNMAFLTAYEGDLKSATRFYRKASMIALEPEVMDQVEQFIVWLLIQEPHKYELYYCLGYFNWKVKGDFTQARLDFQAFLDARKDGQYGQEARMVEGWLPSLKGGS